MTIFNIDYDFDLRLIRSLDIINEYQNKVYTKWHLQKFSMLLDCFKGRFSNFRYRRKKFGAMSLKLYKSELLLEEKGYLLPDPLVPYIFKPENEKIIELVNEFGPIFTRTPKVQEAEDKAIEFLDFFYFNFETGSWLRFEISTSIMYLIHYENVVFKEDIFFVYFEWKGWSRVKELLINDIWDAINDIWDAKACDFVFFLIQNINQKKNSYYEKD